MLPNIMDASIQPDVGPAEAPCAFLHVAHAVQGNVVSWGQVHNPVSIVTALAVSSLVWCLGTVAYHVFDILDGIGVPFHPFCCALCSFCGAGQVLSQKEN